MLDFLSLFSWILIGCVLYIFAWWIVNELDNHLLKTEGSELRKGCFSGGAKMRPNKTPMLGPPLPEIVIELARDGIFKKNLCRLR